MKVDRVLEPVLTRADQGARLLVMICAAAMVIVVSSQVVMRYVFNGSFDWADEVSRIAFVWTIFLAIPLGIKDGTHVGIDMLVQHFPPRLRRRTSQLMSALAAAMMAVVAWTSVVVALATWSERLGAINVTSSVFFFPVILGAVHAMLHLVHLAFAPVPLGARAVAPETVAPETVAP